MKYYVMSNLHLPKYETYNILDEELRRKIFFTNKILDCKESVIEEWMSLDISLKKIKGKEYSDFPNSEYLLVSEKVKKILSSLNLKNIEFLPIKVCETDETYYYLHVFNFISFEDCVDMELSKVNYVKTARMLMGDKILIKKDFCNEDIFRIEEKTYNIYVSENIKELFEREKVKGYRFENASFN